MEAEFADPAWIFDRSTYGFLADGSIVAAARADGHDRLLHIHPGEYRRRGRVPVHRARRPARRARGGRRDRRLGGRGRGQSPRSTRRRWRRDGRSCAGRRRSRPTPACVSTPGDDPVPRPPTARIAHALFYPPVNAGFTGPTDERPPLLVVCRMAARRRTRRAPSISAIQLLTSRGIAVVDVDYAGSTGYGREYRDALRGRWGIADVDDCVAAARVPRDRGDVDADRLAIEGGSAGGYTTLAALAYHDVFAAGISQFGVADLEALAPRHPQVRSRATWTDWSARTRRPRRRYRERSPVHRLDRIASPILVLQGLDDRVVPPSQAEADRRGPGRERHPACLPRVRGRGSRLPRRGRDPPIPRGRAGLPRRGLRLHASR